MQTFLSEVGFSAPWFVVYGFLWMRYREKLYYRWAVISALFFLVDLAEYVATHQMTLSLSTLYFSKIVFLSFDTMLIVSFIAVFVMRLREYRAGKKASRKGI